MSIFVFVIFSAFVTGINTGEVTILINIYGLPCTLLFTFFTVLTYFCLL